MSTNGKQSLMGAAVESAREAGAGGLGSAFGSAFGSAGVDLLNVLTSDPVSDETVRSFDAIEAELRAFEAGEREKLGLVEERLDQWVDARAGAYTREERARTTILAGGLTVAQDYLFSAALGGLGYKVQPMDTPDTEALRLGKEFGNRGQCNPTYFTVGNLVKHLVHLRDVEGQSTERIVRDFVFLTAGACGPCRFGTYVTEYRKALRDAGFDGFRVLLFQQQGGLKQATGADSGLELTPKFFITVLQSIMAGDVLNAMGYRMRPYELNTGDTDRALEACKKLVHDAFLERSSVLVALARCRRLLAAVPVNRLQPRPKVSIIGEFWAMTTEGDGNYKLQRFLEQEGAEVEVQLVTAWLLYNIWQHRWDTRRRMTLRGDDAGKMGLEGKNPLKKLATLAVAEQALRGAFATYCKAVGLEGYHLSDMDEIATISHQHYDNHLRGGEGHMEVGKLISTVQHKKAHMVVSVKPFGCMPSSGVSDGVQSLITARHPEAIFCAIETTGDGAVNVQSRVQMDLFRARQKAAAEYAATLEAAGLTQERAEALLRARGRDGATYWPAHAVAGTGANLVSELARPEGAGAAAVTRARGVLRRAAARVGAGAGARA